MTSLVLCLQLLTVAEGSPKTSPAVTISAVNLTDWTWQGTWFVDLEGDGRLRVRLRHQPSREGRIDRGSLEKLLAVIERERFFDLDSAYGPRCTDCPVCWLKLEIDGKTKEVTVSPGESVTGVKIAEMERAIRVWDAVKEMAAISDLEDSCHARPTLPKSSIGTVGRQARP